jgi:phosphate starvation-inducible PhoH-like protein
MSETTISFANHDQIRTLFGSRDRFLRKVRDVVGIDVVLRGDDLHLVGDEAMVERGREVLEELRSIVEETGDLQAEDVSRALGQSQEIGPIKAPVKASSKKASIDLFEKGHHVSPRTEGQAEYIRAIREHDLVFCQGPAGCGKTYLAVAMAINALREERVRKIVLVRPAVAAGEQLGFLPGDLLAKVNPYLRPLLDALDDLLDFDQVRQYMEHDVIEIVPLAFMRGRTLNQTFIILDEAQNTTTTQMQMFLTRMGTGAKIIVNGDTTQVDLPSHLSGGMTDAMQRLANIDGVATVSLTGSDIVRHRLVREIVRAYDRDGKRDLQSGKNPWRKKRR